jgi:hypothetical protein
LIKKSFASRLPDIAGILFSQTGNAYSGRFFFCPVSLLLYFRRCYVNLTTLKKESALQHEKVQDLNKTEWPFVEGAELPHGSNSH